MAALLAAVFLFAAVEQPYADAQLCQSASNMLSLAEKSLSLAAIRSDMGHENEVVNQLKLLNAYREVENISAWIEKNKCVEVRSPPSKYKYAKPAINCEVLERQKSGAEGSQREVLGKQASLACDFETWPTIP